MFERLPLCAAARAGYQLRALLVHETFKKVLFLAPGARAEFSSGRVFNLVTSDAETLQVRPPGPPPRAALAACGPGCLAWCSARRSNAHAHARQSMR